MRVSDHLLNDDGELYFLKVQTDNPGGFVRCLWEQVSASGHGSITSDAEGCREWTDRVRDYRTTVHADEVCIRTHAWHPTADKRQLHPDVLTYLQSIGVDAPGMEVCHETN